jgi:hypothetical protein
MASTAALDLVISLKAEGAESGLKNMASHVSALGTAVGTFAGGAALAGVRRSVALSLASWVMRFRKAVMPRMAWRRRNRSSSRRAARRR